MYDTELYAKLLDVQVPWRVATVGLQMERVQVDIHLEHDPGTQWPCPHCARQLPCRDHVEERTWRHLDRGSEEPDDSRYSTCEEVFGGTGAATLYCLEALDAVDRRPGPGRQGQPNRQGHE